MDRKRGWIVFILVFAFVIISIGLVYSASCSVTSSCAAANTVMKLSAATNAHGEFFTRTVYLSNPDCEGMIILAESQGYL